MSDIVLKPDKNKPKLKKRVNGEVYSNRSKFLFSKRKYLLLIIACFTLIIGFALLSGGGAEGYDYNPDIFSLQRRLIAPIIIIIALILCSVSIMTKK